MKLSVNTFRVTSDFNLQFENSLYSVKKEQYARFDYFLDLFEPLVLTMPYEQLEIPYLSEMSRDLFFLLTTVDEEPMENPMLQMIYITRSKLINLVRRTKSFQKTQDLIQHDEKQAFIFSILTLSTLWKWHITLNIDEELTSELRDIMFSNQFDLRTLFSEDFSAIEPYPKRVVNVQFKVAKFYDSAVKNDPNGLDDAVQTAYIHMKNYMRIHQSFSFDESGGDIF